MRPLLNGWRRFGIVIAMLWFIAVISLAFIEYKSKSHGFFVFQSLPVGITFSGNKITLPDSKVIAITEEDEFKLRYEQEKTGKPIHPWEIDWAQLTLVPKVAEIRWLRLGLFALLAPSIAWLLVEVSVLTVAWVRRGFAGKQRDS
ncbi:MAG: hypothetical protein HHJ12_04235 [Glaciimonas sp.]|nr:hypothetical protein [Glaciimonas sp.]